ncbi:MAG: hypothetical protein M0P39_06475 [Rhodocyclaceae bacterium]|nr:hypothetical protein [Rhodocyclaceae bacterium]
MKTWRLLSLLAVFGVVEGGLAGEIIVVPQPESGAASDASIQKDKARAYRKDKGEAGSTVIITDQSSPAERARAARKEKESAGHESSTIIILPQDEDEGLLSPERSAAGRAMDNRARAKEYRRSAEPAGEGQIIVIPPAGSGADVESAHERARENRLRARDYSKGDRGSPSAHIGVDGLPIIACKDTDNVAGRIGDDNLSGSVVTIFRDGKPIKVRCQ